MVRERKMIKTKRHNIFVSADFDNDTFMSTFSVHKNNGSDTNIQSTEHLTLEDFEALEIMIADKIDDFLDMKQRECEECPICGERHTKKINERLQGNMFITKWMCLDCKYENGNYASVWELDENGSQVFGC